MTRGRKNFKLRVARELLVQVSNFADGISFLLDRFASLSRPSPDKNAAWAFSEELPDVLVVELRAYQTRLDALYLEAKDGFNDTEGILNAIPAYVIRSLVGELSQSDTNDDPRSPAI